MIYVPTCHFRHYSDSRLFSCRQLRPTGQTAQHNTPNIIRATFFISISHVTWSDVSLRSRTCLFHFFSDPLNTRTWSFNSLFEWFACIQSLLFIRSECIAAKLEENCTLIFLGGFLGEKNINYAEGYLKIQPTQFGFDPGSSKKGKKASKGGRVNFVCYTFWKQTWLSLKYNFLALERWFYLKLWLISTHACTHKPMGLSQTQPISINSWLVKCPRAYLYARPGPQLTRKLL